MKIYTKKGDDGTTGLLGGTRLPKHHLRIESYGTVDELNAFVGSLRDYELSEGHRRFLINIQEKLFTLGSHLAADPEKNNMKLPELTIHDVAELELAMDKMEELLPEMKFFVLLVVIQPYHLVMCAERFAEEPSDYVLR